MRRRRYQLGGYAQNSLSAADEEWWRNGRFLGNPTPTRGQSFQNMTPPLGSGVNGFAARFANQGVINTGSLSEYGNVNRFRLNGTQPGTAVPNFSGNLDTSVLTGEAPNLSSRIRGGQPTGGQFSYSEPVAGNKFAGIAQGAGKIAPYLSNIANAFRKIPRPQSPTKEFGITADLVNYDAERGELDRTQQGINAGLSQMSSNPSVANAQRSANLGKFLEAKARIGMNEKNTNSAIKNQARAQNSAIQARNVQRDNDFKESQTARDIAQQQMRYQNLANFGDKYQLEQRDKSLMGLEREKLALIPTLYKDTGVVDRNYTGAINTADTRLQNQNANLWNSLSSLRKRRMGGKLKKYC
jgi:hypothetical protein